jgi:hypothetical protein
MGASESLPKASTELKTDVSNLFVLVVTAPPGVGKEGLMGNFIGQNLGHIAYIAMEGAVTASEPVRLSVSRGNDASSDDDRDPMDTSFARLHSRFN